VVAGALVLLLVTPWQNRRPTLAERALAAVGAGPVVHAVVEYSWPQHVVVDLATGSERERVHRAEYWFDDQRDTLRASYSTDGSEPMEYAETSGLSQREPQLDPALAGFATQYRDALANGQAHVAGDATVEGRPAKRIEFAPRSAGAVEEVTVDAKTYLPLSFHTTYPPGRRSPEWRVLTIESIARDAADFSAAKPSPPTPPTARFPQAARFRSRWPKEPWARGRSGSGPRLKAMRSTRSNSSRRPYGSQTRPGSRASSSASSMARFAFRSDATRRQVHRRIQQ
jgi:hypothetical protein